MSLDFTGKQEKNDFWKAVLGVVVRRMDCLTQTAPPSTARNEIMAPELGRVANKYPYCVAGKIFGTNFLNYQKTEEGLKFVYKDNNRVVDPD
jgi:hypothetical protein